MRPGVNATFTSCPAPSRLSRLLHSPENDQVGQRKLSSRRIAEPLKSLDRFECLQNFRQLDRWLTGPVLLRRQANACTVCAAALVRARNVAAEAHAVEMSSENGKADARIFAFSVAFPSPHQ